MKKPVRLDDLPAIGLRAVWHKTETDWRDFLLSTSAPGWCIGWLQIPTNEASTEAAMKAYRYPLAFALPPDVTQDELLKAAMKRAAEPVTTEQRPIFGPN